MSIKREKRKGLQPAGSETRSRCGADWQQGLGSAGREREEELIIFTVIYIFASAVHQPLDVVDVVVVAELPRVVVVDTFYTA